jgi:S-adenosylmethionine hydrolase
VRGSSGWLEVSVNGGSAAERLKLDVGTRLLVRRG